MGHDDCTHNPQALLHGFAAAVLTPRYKDPFNHCHLIWLRIHILRERGREGGREGEREGGREGGRERGREEGKEESERERTGRKRITCDRKINNWQAE